MEEKHYYVSYNQREIGKTTNTDGTIYSVRVIQAKNEGDAITTIVKEKGNKMIYVASIIEITYTQYLSFEEWMEKANEQMARDKEERDERERNERERQMIEDQFYSL